MIRPPPSTGRTPKRLTSLPAREATSMIVNVIGRKIRPVCSGERPSTCCRYRELTNHIGNSAALNSSTIVLAVRSGLVSSLNGISGADANARLDHAEGREQDHAEDDRAERRERVPALEARFHDAVDEDHLADRQRQRAGEVEARPRPAPCGARSRPRRPRARPRSRSED